MVISGDVIKLDDGQRFRVLVSQCPGCAIDLRIAGLPGGSLKAAQEIAEELRSRPGSSTTLAEGTDCASACTVVFASGERRTMEPGSTLIFHGPSCEPLNPLRIVECRVRRMDTLRDVLGGRYPDSSAPCSTRTRASSTAPMPWSP